jgi:hypothetical protein
VDSDQAGARAVEVKTSMWRVDQYILQYETELGPPWKNPDA